VDQAVEHFTYLADVSLRRLKIGLPDIAQVSRHDHMRFKFEERTSGNYQELHVFFGGSSSPTFGDVRGDRSNCTANLRGESELLIRRETSGHQVNFRYQSDCLLPDLKFLVILH